MANNHKLIAQLLNNLESLTAGELEVVTERILVQQVCQQLGISPGSLDAQARSDIGTAIQNFIDQRADDGPPTSSSQQPLAKRQRTNAAAAPAAGPTPQRPHTKIAAPTRGMSPTPGQQRGGDLDAKWRAPAGSHLRGEPDPSPGDSFRPAAAAAKPARASTGPAAERGRSPLPAKGGGAAAAASAGAGAASGGTLTERILAHLSALPADSPGQDAFKVGSAVKASRKEANGVLYSLEKLRHVLKSADTKPLWRINPDAPAGAPAESSGRASAGGGAAARSGGGGAAVSFPGAELGGKKRLTVSVFGGKARVDIREFYEKDGEQLPGKKGISLPRDQWEVLVRHIGAIDEALGVGGGGGEGGEGRGEDDD